MIDGIILIVGALLCLPSLVAKKSPELKEVIDKNVVPFQGWLGIVLALWGVYGVIFSGILGLSSIGRWPLEWATTLAVNVFSLGVGIILGYGMIQKFILKDADAEVKAKGEEVYQKLLGVQTKLGIFAFFVGVWAIVYDVLSPGLLNF